MNLTLGSSHSPVVANLRSTAANNLAYSHSNFHFCFQVRTHVILQRCRSRGKILSLEDIFDVTKVAA